MNAKAANGMAIKIGKEGNFKLEKGGKMSDETRKKISAAMCGEKNHRYGIPLSAKAKENLRECRKYQKHPWLGKHLSKEHKQKISDAVSGEQNSFYGKKHSIESKEKMKRNALRGPQSASWKGGISKDKKYRREQKKQEKHKRRASENKSVGSFSVGEWETLKKQYDHTCPMCSQREPNIKLTIDHIIPISKGGSNWIQNIQPLCHSCNSRKNTKIFRIKANGEIKLF